MPGQPRSFELRSIVMSSEVPTVLPFDSWESQRVKLEDVNMFFRIHGTGPPILLLHGVPQHSLMFHTIAPLLARDHAVIVPDLPGMGQSTLPISRHYSAMRAAHAVYAILKFLSISRVSVFSFERGSAVAVVLAAQYPNLVAHLIVSEYALPGFGQEAIQNPSPGKTSFEHWQLALFTVPEAAEFLIRGREEEFLGWYFWHASYSGSTSVSNDHLARYARELKKPGFLWAMVCFAGGTIWEEFRVFRALRTEQLQLPIFVLVGEAIAASDNVLKALWTPVAQSCELQYVPKAGHWLGDENPKWVVNAIEKWIDSHGPRLDDADFGWLKDKITMV